MREIIEVIAAASMPIGLLLVMWHRTKTEKGLGVRVIQTLGVILIIPAIIILAMEKILDGQTVAALFGGLLGYLLSGISNYDKSA